MCAITGFYLAEATAKTISALKAMRLRGQQAAGIYDGKLTLAKTPDELQPSESNHCLGHLLHAMVGCLPQPLQAKGVLVANCEIYNWKELCSTERISAENDAEMLLHLLDKYYPDIPACLELLDGVYAFAYERDGVVTVCRDILGVKPLYYSAEQGFAFASEKKALAIQGYTQARELYPRTILAYNTLTKEFTETQREFFEIIPEHSASYEEQRNTVAMLLQEAVEKRVPDAKFGLLLSGGVDSSTIALLLKQLKPTCYVVGKQGAPDVQAASAVAEKLGLQLTIIQPEDLERELHEIMTAIEDCNPVKVSVAATFWYACRQAQLDGCKALFSGLGAEELFAGYERHRKSTAINKECLAGLRKLHERDLYRDDVITMHHGVELRLPFLDKALVEYSLKIPGKYKISDDTNKKILRDAAVHLGVMQETAFRPKKAAQYGSRVMHELEHLARERKQSIACYLSALYGKKNKKLACLLSTGKDSVLALHIMHDMQYDIACCVTIESSNPDSFMYHTPNIQLASLQAQAMALPLITAKTAGEKEAELSALYEALAKARMLYGVEGVIVGAIASQYQRERVEQVADSLGLTVFAPLWQMDQEKELRLLVNKEFLVVLTRAAAEGLDETWLGKQLDDAMIVRLVALQQSVGVHPSGEGGEYESLVLDAPLFRKKLVLKDTESIKDGSAVTLLIKDAELQDK